MRPPATRTLAAAWLLAWLGLAVAWAAACGWWTDFYGGMGVELPVITASLIAAGDALRAGWGFLLLAPLLALGLAPLRVLPGEEPAARRWLALGLDQALVAPVFVWAALHLPLQVLMKHLDCDDPSHHHGAGPPMLWLLGLSAVGLLGLGLLQVHAWGRLALAAARHPRDATAGVEAARAAILAALPALALGVVAHAAVDELRIRARPAGVVVSPAVAAACTAALVTYGAALAWRLRAARPASAA